MKFTPPYSADFSARAASADVDPQFPNRWSPRAFKKIDIEQQTLEAIFDAARWSPSCYNAQPWQFVTSSDDSFETFLGLLNEGNRAWAQNASLLGFILARKEFEHNGNPNQWAAFDCGAAWMALTLQANKFGLYTHGLGGVLYEDIYPALDIDPSEYQVICGFALGALDSREQLPEALAAKEQPSPRRPLEQIWQQR